MDYYKIDVSTFKSENILTEIQSNLKKHIIIDTLQCNCSIENISILLNEIQNRKEKGFFTAIINGNINIDDLEDEINIAPTLQEAIDMINMEIMMRDL